MNKRNQNVIFAIALVILLVVIGALLFRNNLIGSNEDNKTPVSFNINNISEEKLPVNILITDPFGNSTAYSYDYVEGKSVFDILKELDNSNEGLVVSYTEDPTFGAYINNINNYEIDTSSQFWEFLVNNEQAPLGISSYIVSPGENIEFKITDFN